MTDEIAIRTTNSREDLLVEAIKNIVVLALQDGMNAPHIGIVLASAMGNIFAHHSNDGYWNAKKVEEVAELMKKSVVLNYVNTRSEVEAKLEGKGNATRN